MAYSRYGYPKYISVAEKKAKNQRAAKKLAKKMPDIEPVSISGNKIAKTWWGKAWVSNLKKYSDYANRLGRGSSYLRHGAVLDLKISAGHITAIVQGSKAKPYSVNVDIEPLDKKTWGSIVEACGGKIESLQELIEGKFPEELSELFTEKGNGLFPRPDEISLWCDCPDWADMCKHVVAALYGVGVRLDNDPGLFFILRAIDINELITEAVTNRSDKLISKADKKSKRVIEDESLDDVFDIELD